MITIVTAFFDIGRGDWTPDKGLPHYLERKTDTYLERFGYMSGLQNPMVIFTSEDLVDKIKLLRGDKPTDVLVVDFKNNFNELRNKISEIQKSTEYQSIINPTQIRNPEYWNADYVLVNLLKSSFVNRALQLNLINTDLIAWLDFGYCRNEQTLNGKKMWTYPFNKDKIHFFNLKDYKEGTFIQDIIANNDVHITGPCIVAGKEKWPLLEYLVQHNTNELLKNKLIDDDQTLLLMSYLSDKDSFELHKVPEQDWFIIFRDYNEIYS